MLLLLLLLLNNEREVEVMTWLQAAHTLSLDLEKLDAQSLAEAGFASTSDVLARFASVRKVTVNTARRQLAAANFLRSVLPRPRFEILVNNGNPPFNTVEVLKKIHAIDAKKADVLLTTVLERNITFVEISAKYQSVQNEIPQIGRRMSMRRDTAIEFEREVIDYLTAAPNTLYPESAKLKIKRLRRSKDGFAFALPDAIAVFDASTNKRFDGIEVRMPTDTARHQVWQILERLHLMSTFFTHTWLIVPTPISADQKEFCSGLLSAKSTLGMPSVGIATAELGETVEFSVMVEPYGCPEIDRRNLLPTL